MVFDMLLIFVIVLGFCRPTNDTLLPKMIYKKTILKFSGKNLTWPACMDNVRKNNWSKKQKRDI